jgi:hypothetical protein
MAGVQITQVAVSVAGSYSLLSRVSKVNDSG